MGSQQCRPNSIELASGHRQLLDQVACAVAETCAQPTGCSSRAVKQLGLQALEFNLAATIYCNVAYRDVDDLRDILEGAIGFVIGDFGWLYDVISGMRGAYRCVTPHDSSVPQYALKLSVLGSVVTGRDAQGNSWFQFEPDIAKQGSDWCSGVTAPSDILEFRFSGLSGPKW